MSAHTPGPWKLFKDESRLTDITIVLGPKGEDICAWHRNKDDRRFNEPTLGNQHLISAAPELLAACERAELEFSGGGHSGRGGCDCERCSALIALRAAIAKARGK